MTVTPIRLVPAPSPDSYPVRRQRRYDAARHVQGSLALAFEPRMEPEEPDPVFCVQPTPADLLPDPATRAGALVQAAVEVIAGRRQAAQLQRWMTPAVHERLCRRAQLAARLRTATRSHQVSGRVVIRSVHTSRPADHVVEATVLLAQDGRVRAVAARLEGMDGRWRMTALEIG